MRVAFNPVEHGFGFANAFTNHLVHVPALGMDITTRGRCGGMAYAALDYWHHGLAVPDSTNLPADGTLLADYVMARMNDSAIANAAKNVQFMLTPDNPTWLHGIGVARTTREEEYPRLKQALAAGAPVPLGIVQARDVGALGGDHQVVAYGYEDLGRYSHVFIYDNNAPVPECVLEFTTAYDSSETEVRESVMGMTWRGFFVESYATQLPTFLADGRLLAERSNPAIYVVRGGGRFHIPSPAEFDAGGYDWRAVMQTQPGSLEHVATRPANGTLIRERSGASDFGRPRRTRLCDPGRGDVRRARHCAGTTSASSPTARWATSPPPRSATGRSCASSTTTACTSRGPVRSTSFRMPRRSRPTGSSGPTSASCPTARSPASRRPRRCRAPRPTRTPSRARGRSGWRARSWRPAAIGSTTRWSPARGREELEFVLSARAGAPGTARAAQGTRHPGRRRPRRHDRRAGCRAERDPRS